MTLEGASRSAVIGLSMLASTAILGVVVSAAYRSSGYGVDSSEPPLIRVPQLPWKLPPAARVDESGADASAPDRLDRLLPEEGDESRPAAPDHGDGLPEAGRAPAPSAPLEALSAAPPAPSEPSPGPALPPAAGVEYRVQLLAAADQAAVERAWKELRSRLGAILDDLPMHVEKAQTAADTVYRLQIGSFGGSAAAAAKCAELKRVQTKCFVLRVRPRT